MKKGLLQHFSLSISRLLLLLSFLMSPSSPLISSPSSLMPSSSHSLLSLPASTISPLLPTCISLLSPLSHSLLSLSASSRPTPLVVASPSPPLQPATAPSPTSSHSHPPLEDQTFILKRTFKIESGKTERNFSLFDLAILEIKGFGSISVLAKIERMNCEHSYQPERM